jgi:transcriptional regulator of acetoin/glycerol metabolism
MLAALEHADWRISGRGGAAELLGLKASTLTDRLRAFGIERRRDGGSAATQS